MAPTGPRRARLDVVTGYEDLATLRCSYDDPPVTADDGATARVLLVRFCNPPTDLLDAAVMADLDTLGRRLAGDRSVRAVVLTGPRPGVFLPHYELEEIAAGAEQLGVAPPYALARAVLAGVSTAARVPGVAGMLARTPAAGVLELLRTHATLTRLTLLPQVVVAAVDGDALGGGCEVALACDLRVMSRGPYRIGLPEVSAGIPPGAGGTPRLARAIGPARARSMMLRARPYDADEALAAGLVDEAEPPEATLPRALELARQAARRSPAAVLAVKRTLADRGLRRALSVEAAGFMAVAATPAAVARLRAFAAASTADRARTPWRDRTWLE